MLTRDQIVINELRDHYRPAPPRLLARLVDTPPHRVCVACGERKMAKRFRAHTRMCRACENNRKGHE